MKNNHCILQNIGYKEVSHEEDIQKQRQQLIQVVWRLERKIVELIFMTLDLLGTNQNLVRLAVYLPSVDVGDMSDLGNDNLYFAEEAF